MSMMGMEGDHGAHALQRHQPLKKHPRHRLLLHHPRWHVIDDEEEGNRFWPSFFNPTRITFYDPTTGVKVHWYSREHRKGRFGRAVQRAEEKLERPRFNLWGFEPRNISWWVAQLFLWGSAAWVLNGHFLLFPGDGPSEKLNTYFTAYSVLVGGTLFWTGAYLAVLEALNAALEVRFEQELEIIMESPVRGFLHDGVEGEEEALLASRRWRWFIAEPYRMHDMGYIAAMIQWAGATLFSVSTVVALPGVFPSDSSKSYTAWDITDWTLQVVGAWGFIISALMFCSEVQSCWWKPSPRSLGWQVGFWNLIGAVSFEFSGIFGYWERSGRYQRFGTSLSTYWGSWAFLIGSYFQLLEVLNKHPVDVIQ